MISMRKDDSRIDSTARLWIIALLLGLAATCARMDAQTTPQTQAISHETIGRAQGVLGQLATATVNVPNVGAASFCMGTVEGAGVRYWLDGSAPTSTGGHFAAAGGQVTMPSNALAAGFVFTPIGGAATLQVSCFRGGNASAILAAFDPTQATRPVYSSASAAPALPLPQCNAVRTTGCQK